MTRRYSLVCASSVPDLVSPLSWSQDKREGDIRLKIVPFGDLPVPLPLSLTGREYGLKAEWIDKWTPSPFFGPSPSSARVGSENSHHDELSNRRDDVGPSRPSRPGSAIGNMADTERAASRPDEDVMMSAPDEVLPDLSGPSVEPKESAEVADVSSASLLVVVPTEPTS